MRSIRLWMWCRRFFEKRRRVRAVSIHVLPSEDHARWHFLEENATWSLRFCKEQNRNRCSRASRVLASQQVSRAFRVLADLFAGWLRISSVKDCYVADGFVDALESFGGYFDADCSHVVRDLLGARRANDCGSYFGPAQNPGKGHLRHRQAEVGGYGLELLDRRKQIV